MDDGNRDETIVVSVGLEPTILFRRLILSQISIPIRTRDHKIGVCSMQKPQTPLKEGDMTSGCQSVASITGKVDGSIFA